HRPRARAAQGSRRGTDEAAGGTTRRQQRRGGAPHPDRSGEPARRAGGHDGRCGAPRRRTCCGRCLMAIWLTRDSNVIVQGITGSEGTKHTRRMVASGTNVVGGVNARKEVTDVEVIPVIASVEEAM